MFTTGLPDLPKPSRDLLELRKTDFFRDDFFEEAVFFSDEY